jgi:dCTP deaminase
VTTAQHVLGRILFELLNRSRRLRNYLKEIGPGESNEFAQLSRTISSALDQFEATAIAAVKQTRLDTIDAADQKLLLGALEVFSRAFSTIHEYLTYFPPLPIRPETIQALTSTFGGEFRRHEPSVLLTSAFNAFEFDFVRHLTSSLAALQVLTAPTERNIVLQLPTVDVASPTAWPLLAHEVGHAIDFDHGISTKIAARLAPGTKRGVRLLMQDLCEEITADLIAARTVGPAATFALLSFVYCLLPQEAIEWDPSSRLNGSAERVYPATRWRARVAYNYLSTKTSQLTALEKEVSEFEDAWTFRANVILGQQRAQTAADNEQRVFDGLITTLVREITKEVDALPVRDFSTVDEDLDRHVRRLHYNLPVGAQGQARHTLLKAVDLYRNLQQRTRADIDAVIRRFEEKPTGIAAILLSGFLHRGKLIADMSAQPGAITPASAKSLCDSLDRCDALLRTSIETSEVHRRLLDRRRANEVALRAAGVAEAARPNIVMGANKADPASLLSDIQILARLVDADDGNLLFVSPVINPVTQLGPSSLDVRLGTDVFVTTISTLSHLDLEADRDELERQKRLYFRRHRVGSDGVFVLHPGQFVLASTLEYFRFPRDIAGRLEGRSSLGRLGLQVHATAGFVDPGFEGNLTFELINSGNLPMRIAPGFRLGQICFFPVSEVQLSYGEKPDAKYPGSISAELSRVETDREILYPGADKHLLGETR